MTTPTSQLFAGSRLTALGIRGSAPLAAYKSSSQTASGSTLGNDSALVLALQASAVYRFALVFGYTGGTLGSSDLKFGWSLPSGASMGYSVYGNTTAGAATAAPWYTDSSSPAALGSNGSTPISAVMAGTVAVSEVVLHEDWIGHRVTDLEQATGARVAFLIRFGAGVLPEPKSVIQSGDQVYVAAISCRAAEAVAIDALPPGEDL